VELTPAKKVVIITEAVIEEQVIRLLNAQGVKGYTVYRNLTGKGARGVRSGLGGLEKLGENVRIEVVVAGEEQAHAIMEAVYGKFLAEKYAGITYLEDIRVIRPEKF
jgi:nitrogen regulatory protein PII